MADDRLRKIAIPGVVLLISFLAYSSQLLFLSLDPGPLSQSQTIKFNAFLTCLWICYARTCLTSPGRVPDDWLTALKNKPDDSLTEQNTRTRFCRKCNTVKPPRSHHCKVCQRCIPKMDHHCPWTANCVSHFTFPHFIRFLFYAVSSMIFLEYLVYVRAAVIWENRNLPSYLGPSISQLILLFCLLLINSLTLFLVGISFLRAVYALTTNVSTIESWEIERHSQLLRRARVFGGVLDGPDGIKVKIVRQEFPYDIGIWKNIRDGMGTGNMILWFWPFASTPKTSGIAFDTNGFEDPGTTWPPPDPDRMPRIPRLVDAETAFVYDHGNLTAQEEVQAFRTRQQVDIERRQAQNGVLRRKAFHHRFGNQNGTAMQDDYFEDNSSSYSGEESWQDSGGNRLDDYGVEEDIEFYDEDDIPITELLRRREGRKREV